MYPSMWPWHPLASSACSHPPFLLPFLFFPDISLLTPLKSLWKGFIPLFSLAGLEEVEALGREERLAPLAMVLASPCRRLEGRVLQLLPPCWRWLELHPAGRSVPEGRPPSCAAGLAAWCLGVAP